MWDVRHLGMWQQRNMMTEEMSTTARLKSLDCCVTRISLSFTVIRYQIRPNMKWHRQDTSAHLLTVKTQVILQDLSLYYSKRKKITFYLSQDCFEFPDASYWAGLEGCVDLLEFWYSNTRDWRKGSILNIIKTVNQNPKLEYSSGSINVSSLSNYLWKIPMSKFDNRWCTACSCGEMLA